MAVDLHETKMINDYLSSKDEDGEIKTVGEKLTEEEVDELFDNLDVSKFNKNE